MSTSRLIPRTASAEPSRPTRMKLFSDSVICPLKSQCRKIWATPLRMHKAHDDVEYSDYRLQLKLVSRIRRHFSWHHSEIRGKMQINVTVNSTGNRFALSTSKIGQCPTCGEQLVWPTEEQKIESISCAAMARLVNHHRSAAIACLKRLHSLYNDEDLGNMIPKTFIWGSKPRMPIVKGIRWEEAQLWDLKKQALRGTPSPSNGDDERVEDTPEPIVIARRRPGGVKTKNSKGAGAIPGPASASKRSLATTPLSVDKSASRPENANNESTAPSSLTEDVSIPSPPALQLHTPRRTHEQTRGPRARRPVPIYAVSCKKFRRTPIYAMSCLDISVCRPSNGLSTKSHTQKPCSFPLAKVNKPERHLVAKRGDTSYRGKPVAGLLKAAEINALDKNYGEWRQGRARESPRCTRISIASLLNPAVGTDGNDLEMMNE
ncbi:hypothetical protein BGX38DRAFT_1272866 [Terfezia claveryi]|nr:hypothetical protein BGX38DRAFT_1272866 [Terfezia claveryi]